MAGSVPLLFDKAETRGSEACDLFRLYVYIVYSQNNLLKTPNDLGIPCLTLPLPQELSGALVPADPFSSFLTSCSVLFSAPETPWPSVHSLVCRILPLASGPLHMPFLLSRTSIALSSKMSSRASFLQGAGPLPRSASLTQPVSALVFLFYGPCTSKTFTKKSTQSVKMKLCVVASHCFVPRSQQCLAQGRCSH